MSSDFTGKRKQLLKYFSSSLRYWNWTFLIVRPAIFLPPDIAWWHFFFNRTHPGRYYAEHSNDELFHLSVRVTDITWEILITYQKHELELDSDIFQLALPVLPRVRFIPILLERRKRGRRTIDPDSKLSRTAVSFRCSKM